MRRIVITLVVGALVVGLAAVAVAQTGEEEPPLRGPGAVLEEALERLVGDGTLEQAQADAVLAEVGDLREERRELREETHALVLELWEDGVLTPEEVTQLPEWHPLRDPEGPVAAYLADGELTRDDLERLHGELGFHGLHRRAHHGMAGMGFGPFGWAGDS